MSNGGSQTGVSGTTPSAPLRNLESGCQIQPILTPTAVDVSDMTPHLPKSASKSPDAQEPSFFFDAQEAANDYDDPAISRVDQAASSKTAHDNVTATQAPKRSTFQRADTVPHRVLRPSVERHAQTERPKPSTRHSDITDEHQAPSPHDLDSFASTKDSTSGEDTDQEARSNERTVAGGASTKKRPRMVKKSNQEKDFSRFNISNPHYKTSGNVSKRDGRLNISMNETANNGYIAKALGRGIQHHLDIPDRHGRYQRPCDEQLQQPHVDDEGTLARSGGIGLSSNGGNTQTLPRPVLNIVIMVIGSRGDIQPFLKVGKILKNDYGHRVRIATHPAFREFIEKDSGLEFFSVGGDPSELMAFMVKNPGLIPSLETVRAGEIQRRRQSMAEMFEGFWRACVNATDDEKDKANMKMMGDKSPFVADAIIANPPSFAHVHIAERLGIPLHMMFTFPYSPTQAFPHPVANIKPQKSNVDANYVNFMSYPLVEMMTWQGLGDLVNKFRVKTLGLEPVSSLWAPGALYRMKVPYTYMWSRELVPKPADWGPEIDIAGFVFLDLASSFEPPQDLTDFLKASERPIYIGFGSIVVDDPEKFTQLIFEAVKLAGVRALVSKGWGGLGDDNNTPDNIYMLGNTPHDWLFPQVSAVVHHGGAGTTAIGLKCAKPTMIVPFFGDQPFWGTMVADHKAGAHQSIPYRKLTVERFAEGIKQCLTQEARDNAQKIADSIAKEGDGAANAVKSFERSLPLAGPRNMRCSILEDRVAVWQLRHSTLRLSALAATLLIDEKKLRWHDLRLLRHYEWNDFDGPGEPISGMGGAIVRSGTGIAKGVSMVPVRMAKHIRQRDQHDRKKAESRKRREQREIAKAASANEESEVTSEGIETNTDNAKIETTKRQPGPQRQDTGATGHSVMSADPEEPLAQELAGDAGEGLRRAGSALAGAPLDLGLALAQGFHNAPRLYGDASVRKPNRITGLRSGVKAAGHEFAFGIYDGWTGLVTQPIGGWQDGQDVSGRFAGLGKGLAKGVGGFVLKNISAVITPPAFLGQGIRKDVKKRLGGPGGDSWIRKAHIIRGQKDLKELTSKDDGQESLNATQRRVDDAWRVMSEVWDTVEHERRQQGKLRGSIAMRREKKKWEENGALENVTATHRALETRRQGGDLEEMFRQRRKEMEVAQKPRAGVLDQSETYEEKKGVQANGHRNPSSAAHKFDRPSSQDANTATYESDSTAVATPEAVADLQGQLSSGKVDIGPQLAQNTMMQSTA